MAAIDYEAEYNNRARVPEHAEIFARWMRDAELYRADTLKAGPRRARPGVRRHAAAIPRSVPCAGRRRGAAGAVHSWRLLALARSVHVQPHGARLERARHHGRGRGLRSVPDRHHRRHHRANAPRLLVPVAAARSADVRHRPFRRRASCRRHGRHRLAVALSQGAGRSDTRGLCDLRPVRSHAAPWREHEPGFAADRRRRAQRLAGFLAARGPAAPWMRSSARWNRASSGARASSSCRRGRARARRATRRSPAPTISPCATRSPIRRAQWSRASPNWRCRSRRSAVAARLIPRLSSRFRPASMRRPRHISARICGLRCI